MTTKNNESCLIEKEEGSTLNFKANLFGCRWKHRGEQFFCEAAMVIVRNLPAFVITNYNIYPMLQRASRTEFASQWLPPRKVRAKVLGSRESLVSPVAL